MSSEMDLKSLIRDARHRNTNNAVNSALEMSKLLPPSQPAYRLSLKQRFQLIARRLRNVVAALKGEDFS